MKHIPMDPTKKEINPKAPCRISERNTNPQHVHDPIVCVNHAGYLFKECIKCERDMLNFGKQADKLCINCEYEEK